MFNKTLEKRIEIIPNEKETNGKSLIGLEYYLLEGEVSGFDEMNGRKVYGIEIVKFIDGKEHENELVESLTCYKENAREIINRLAANTVTPVGLIPVLEDMVGV